MPPLDWKGCAWRRITGLGSAFLLLTTLVPSTLKAAPGVTNAPAKKSNSGNGEKAKAKGLATARIAKPITVSLKKGTAELLRAGIAFKETASNGDVIFHLQ